MWTNATFWTAVRDAILQSWPILLVQCVAALAFVYLEQGRAFLMIQNVVTLSYLLLATMVQTSLYARVLTRTADPHPDSRSRYEGLLGGALVSGIIGGFAVPVVLEGYMSTHACALPVRVVEDFKGSAAAITVILAVALLVVPTMALSSDRGKAPPAASAIPNTLLIGWFLLAGAIMNRVGANRRLAVFAALLAVGFLGWGALRQARPPMATVPSRRLELVALASGAAWLSAGIAAAIFPFWIQGSGAALIVVLQFWTAVGVVAAIALRRARSHSNVAFATAIIVLLIGFWLFSGRAFHARDVRTTADSGAVRSDLVAHAGQWLAARRAEIAAASAYPVIVVAAEGGGIRAAYWTAGLLAALTDRDPAFAHHLFGISSVSGGSVGAGVFAALVKSRCTDCQRRAALVLADDFLAPTMPTMLIRDVLSSTLRVGWTDRGAVLEEAFERSWENTMGSAVMAEPLAQLWSNDDAYRVPALFLNTTDAASAKRVVVSHLTLPESPGLDTDIQRTVAAASFRLSTAAMLSARFPYVSPEGRLPATSIRLVDGGFFDNSGGATALEITRALRHAAEAAKLADRIRVIAVIVENGADAPSRCPEEEDPGGIATPLTILDGIRAAQAARFAEEFRLVTTQQNGIVVDRVRPTGGAVEFPLGWTLSSETRDEMDRQITALKASTTGAIDEMFKLISAASKAEGR